MNRQRLDEFLDRYPGIGVRVEREVTGRVTFHAHGPAHLRAVLLEDLEREMPLGTVWRVVDETQGTVGERDAARLAARSAARLRLHGTPPPAPTRGPNGKLIPRAPVR